MLALKVRDTVQRVVGASRHLLWYLDWQTGGSRPRAAPERARRRVPEPARSAA